jgi:hypothetical protein
VFDVDVVVRTVLEADEAEHELDAKDAAAEDGAGKEEDSHSVAVT